MCFTHTHLLAAGERKTKAEFGDVYFPGNIDCTIDPTPLMEFFYQKLGSGNCGIE